MFSALALLAATSTLLTGGMVIDGSGRAPYAADVRVENGRIAEVGRLLARPGDERIDVHGLVIAPGFIDAHSHADGNLKELESQMRQGITTAICGQDGGRPASVREQKERTQDAPIRFEFFSGHGGLREAVMKDSHRKAAPYEIERMKALLEEDMKAGALGLSTGLEYDPGHYCSTEELIALARVAGKYGGSYISHVRDETSGIFDSIEELIRIGREGKLPAQVSHIKMGVASVWGKAPQAIAQIEAARKKGQDVTADVYPYLYWQSTIRVLTTSREYQNRQVWVDALKDVGGPSHVRLTAYSVDPKWQDKTLEQISRETGKDAPALIMEIIEKTDRAKGRESVLVEAMTESDLVAFIKQPWIMFCSDGSGGGSHPRSAGSFPRVLARFVRELHVITLPEAIRKMTSLPAWRFKLKDRGYVRPGYSGDLVVFDPARIQDMATPENPKAVAVGIRHLFVRGVRHDF